MSPPKKGHQHEREDPGAPRLRQPGPRETWAVLSILQPEDVESHVYTTEGVEWKVRDVLAHLADAERGLLGQIRRLLVGQPTVPDDFDLNRWNRSAVRRRKDQTYAKFLPTSTGATRRR